MLQRMFEPLQPTVVLIVLLVIQRTSFFTVWYLPSWPVELFCRFTGSMRVAPRTFRVGCELRYAKARRLGNRLQATDKFLFFTNVYLQFDLLVDTLYRYLLSQKVCFVANASEKSTMLRMTDATQLRRKSFWEVGNGFPVLSLSIYICM